jgi:hypothetical protein
MAVFGPWHGARIAGSASMTRAAAMILRVNSTGGVLNGV